MSSTPQGPRRSLVLFTCIVLVLGAGTAWFFGSVAGSGYGFEITPLTVSQNRVPAEVGQWWGAFTGLVAGVIWCRLLIPTALRSSGGGLAGAGALAGLCVGLLSTVLLHAVLMFVSSRSEPIVLGIGLACGMVAGPVVGAICGALLRWFVPAATPPAEAPPAAPGGEDEAG